MITSTAIASVVGRAVLMFGIVAIVFGCGPDGPSRYSISGSVTFQGKPVPVGFIKFEPDTAKSNAGPVAKRDAGGSRTHFELLCRQLPGRLAPASN
jgi:hypothetical protein